MAIEIINQTNSLIELQLSKGEKGLQGDSAYQQAVEGGYTDTEANFNARLSEINKLANVPSDTNEELLNALTLSKNSIKAQIGLPKTDGYGLKTVNILGDSIAHGANAPDIYKDSWVAILRKALQIEYDNDNHGFINLKSPLSNIVGTYTDFLYISTNWGTSETNDTLGFYQLSTSGVDKYIKAYPQIRLPFSKVGIACRKRASAGNIEITIKSSSTNVVSTASLVSATEDKNAIIFIDTSMLEDIKEIQILHKTGANFITGIYLIDNDSDIMINNYSRSGARIIDLGVEILEKAFNTNILIFSLGHNDTPETVDTTLATCVSYYNIYKPYVVVCDFGWTLARAEMGLKLKQFAENCNGIYVDFVPKILSANDYIDNGFLTDVSHPSVDGHRLIAERLLSTLKTSIISKQTINKYLEFQSGVTVRKTLVAETGFTVFNSAWEKRNQYHQLTLDITGTITGTSTLCLLDIPLKSVNLIGFLWNGATYTPTPCYIDGTTGAFVVSAGANTGTRFTIAFSYISKI